MKRLGFFALVATGVTACVARVSGRTLPSTRLHYLAGDSETYGFAIAERSYDEVGAVTDEMRAVLGRGRIYTPRTVYMDLGAQHGQTQKD